MVIKACVLCCQLNNTYPLLQSFMYICQVFSLIILIYFILDKSPRDCIMNYPLKEALISYNNQALRCRQSSLHFLLDILAQRGVYVQGSPPSPLHYLQALHQNNKHLYPYRNITTQTPSVSLNISRENKQRQFYIDLRTYYGGIIKISYLVTNKYIYLVSSLVINKQFHPVKQIAST